MDVLSTFIRVFVALILGVLVSNAKAEGREQALLSASLAMDSLPQKLNSLPERAKVRIDSVPLDAQGSKSAALTLEKFTVFSPDAIVVVDSGSRAERRFTPPTMAHFRGEVEGYPGSSAFWSVAEDGQMKGVLRIDGQIIVAEQTPASINRMSASTARQVDKTHDFAGQSFICDAEKEHDRDFFTASRLGQASALPKVAELTNTVYTARVALETDYEFFQKFGTEAAATQYIADLFGYISTTYAAEIKTNLQVGTVYLYTSSNDPWTATTTDGALDEVLAYWNLNRTGVTRTVTHFMSAKAGGGLAYVGVLCEPSWGYGVSFGLKGDFSAANPQIVWDADVIAHEIGHNFGSPHTHQWDTKLSGSPIDCCYANADANPVCTAGNTDLPGVGSLTGGTPGTGAGTIMSYCHTRAPGLSNTSFTFGLNHTMGISPARVPTQMRTTLEAAVLQYPSCIVPESSYSLTVSKSGAGTGTVTSSPANISCGATCSASFVGGTAVILTATPDAGSAFSSWSGCDSVSGATCNVTVNGTRTVTASFSSSGSAPVNLIGNAGFESGAVTWTQSSTGNYPLIGVWGKAHAGTYSAWLGGYVSGTDLLEQSVTIPSAAKTATVDFWYLISTNETTGNTAYDKLFVELYDSGGTTKLATLTTLSNLNATTAWLKSASFDVIAYKGQTVRLRFTATNDSSYYTSFFVDDVSLTTTSAKNRGFVPILMMLTN